MTEANSVFLLQNFHLQEDKDSLPNPWATNFYCDNFSSTLQGEEKSFLNTTFSQPFEDRPLAPHTSDWVIIISLILLFLLAFVKLIFRKPFVELMKGNSKSQAYNSDVSRTRLPSFFFVTCTCTIFSLAVYVFFYQLSENKDIMIFLRTFIMVAVFFIFRLFLVKFVGLLFNLKQSLSEWNYLIAMLNFVSSVACFPVIFIAYHYSFSFFWGLVLAVFAAVFLFGFVRGWTIFSKKIRVYEYFLYLCTIEILPLLIFFKFAVNRL